MEEVGNEREEVGGAGGRGGRGGLVRSIEKGDYCLHCDDGLLMLWILAVVGKRSSFARCLSVAGVKGSGSIRYLFHRPNHRVSTLFVPILSHVRTNILTTAHTDNCPFSLLIRIGKTVGRRLTKFSLLSVNGRLRRFDLTCFGRWAWETAGGCVWILPS